MQEAQNQIHIDLKDNPDLKDFFSNLDVGEETELTISIKLQSKSDEAVVATVTKIEPEDYKNPNPEEGEEADEVTPDATTPVSMAMGKHLGMMAGQEKPD